MNKPLLKQALDALLASRCYVDVEGSDAELDVHRDVIAALDAELAKPDQKAELDQALIALRIKEEEHKCCAEDLLRWRKSAESAIQENVELRAELATPDHEPIAYIFQKFCSDSFGGGWEERIERKVPSYYTTKNIQPLYAAPPEPEGCLSNCDTCTYAWGSPANPGDCFMFFEEPQGVCPKHSEPGQTRNCSRHPAAPHGPDGAGCKCHSWAPGEAS